VTVTDPETDVNTLTYRWSSSHGTFSGSGRTVIWTAPPSAPTPVDVLLTVEVVEPYQSQGRTTENRVSGSTTVTLHNSVREVGEMARQFLLDFSDSRLDVAYVMRNFEPGCYGTAAETEQVTQNRDDFTIEAWNIGDPVTTVGFGGFCARPSHPGDACSTVPASWVSRAKKDLYNSSGTRIVMRKGQVQTVEGVDRLAAMYFRNQKRWKLCDSTFDGTNSTSLSPVDLESMGLVP